MGYCPFLVLCRDRVSRPRTQHDLGARSRHAQATGRARDRVVSVSRHGRLCRDMAVCVATRPASRPDFLGHDKVLLCYDSA